MSSSGNNVAYLRIEADTNQARVAVQKLGGDFSVLDKDAHKAAGGIATLGKTAGGTEQALKELTGKSRQDWAKFQRDLTTATTSGAKSRELAIKREYAAMRRELREYLNDGRISRERYDSWLTSLNHAQTRKIRKLHAEELKNVSALDKGYARLATSVKAFVGAYLGYQGMKFGIEVARQSYQVFREFESATKDMTKITDKNLGLIKEEILELPAVLGNATSLMRGYYQAISAQAKDPLDTLVTASKAAKAAHVEQADTIKALTKLMAGYSGQIKTATEASDLLFAIEKQGQTSFAELVPVIGEVAAVSNQAGVNQYEMAAALAAMTQTAGSTSQAATQYKAVIMGLFKPQEEMRKALEALGFESGKAAVQTLGFSGTLQALQGYADRTGVGLGKLFESSEALTGIGPLLETAFAGYIRNLDEMRKSAGATDKAFRDWQDTSDATEEVFNNTIGKFATKFGEELAPEMRRGMTDITDWLNNNKEEIYAGFEHIADGVGLIAEAARTSYSAYRYLTLKIAGGIAVARGEVPTAQVVEFLKADVAEMEKMLTYFGKLKRASAADAAIMQDGVQTGTVLQPGQLEKEYHKQLEGIKDAWMLSNNYIGQNTKDTIDELVDKATSGSELITDKEWKEINKRIKAGKKEADAYSAAVAARSVITREQEGQITLALQEHREKRRKKLEAIHKKMLSGAEHLEEGYWKKRKDELDKQYEYLKDHVQDKAALEIWYGQETRKLEQDRLRKSSLAARAEFENKAYNADNWLDFAKNKAVAESGVWKDHRTRELEEWEGYYSHSQDALRGFSSDVQSTASDMLFDGLKGQWKGLKDYTDSILDSMLRSMSEYATKMAAEWAGSKLMSWGSSLLDGIFTFHSGTMDIKEDEVLAKLQRGEMVIPARQADTIRQAIGSSGISKSEYFDRVAGMVNVGSRQVQPISREQLGDYAVHSAFGLEFGEHIGKAYSSLFGGGLAAYSNYSKAQELGSQLQSSGLSISGSKIDSVAHDAALSGFGSAMFAGLGSWVGDVMSYAMGVKEYSKTALMLNAGLATLAGLSGAGVVAAALSPVTALAVSGIADMMDLRENESLRDALEDMYGAIAGRQLHQGLQSRILMELTDGTYLVNTLKGTLKLTPTEAAKELGLMVKEDFDPVEQMLKVAYLGGKSSTSAIWGMEDDRKYGKKTGKQKKIELSQGVLRDWGWFGYESRQNALEHQGFPAAVAKALSRQHDSNFTDRDLRDAARSSGTSFARDGKTYDSHGRSYDKSKWGLDTSSGGDGARERGSGMHDESHGGKTGYGGTSGASGYTGGRRYGGPIDQLVVPPPPGEDGWAAVKFGEFVLSESSLSFLDDLLIGRVPSALAPTASGDTSALAAAVERLAEAVASGASAQPLTIQLVTTDGKVLEQARIDRTQEALKNGEIVVPLRNVVAEVM